MFRRALHVIITIIIILGLLRLVFDYLWPFAAGALLSFIVYPVVKFMFTLLKIPYRLSVIFGLMVAFITGPLIITGFFALFENELSSFIRYIPDYAGIIKNFIYTLPLSLQELTEPYISNEQLALVTDETGKLILTAGKQLVTASSSWAVALPSYFFSAGIVLIVSYYVLADFKAWLQQLPKDWTAKLKNVGTLGIHEAGSYVAAQFLLAMITFMISMTGFLFLGFEHPFLMALLSAMLDFVPVAGSLLLFLPLMIFCFFESGPEALFVLLIYLVIVGVRQVMEPKMIGTSMGIHPLLALMVLYVSVQLTGLKGLFLTPFFLIVLSVLIKAKLFYMIWLYVKSGKFTA
ncbi:AI-2E family transporter [Jeotgalibacillus terrae]|uniref:AI-2E family transporter n=1 Tax=Jeotgalibacillus terrae TaxID=587735 RepID=A0ABW5ZKL9_9BACL|nr:AI-2E family transporter [Jeotgalibacillus terrae]MBM7578923.1 sporulation integral membrane protein YtvI [Jeotgalibacillus terrae]